MIYITSSAFFENNNFEVSSVYIISDTDSYVITKSNDWMLMSSKLDTETIQSMINDQEYNTSQVVYSPLRKYDDNDPLAFASFLRDKVRNGYGTEFNKKLFRILSNIGKEV